MFFVFNSWEDVFRITPHAEDFVLIETSLKKSELNCVNNVNTNTVRTSENQTNPTKQYNFDKIENECDTEKNVNLNAELHNSLSVISYKPKCLTFQQNPLDIRSNQQLENNYDYETIKKKTVLNDLNSKPINGLSFVPIKKTEFEVFNFQGHQTVPSRMVKLVDQNHNINANTKNNYDAIDTQTASIIRLLENIN